MKCLLKIVPFIILDVDRHTINTTCIFKPLNSDFLIVEKIKEISFLEWSDNWHVRLLEIFSKNDYIIL